MRSARETAALAMLGGSLVVLFLYRKLLATTRKLEFLSECVKQHDMGLEYLTQQLEALREGDECKNLSPPASTQHSCSLQKLYGSSKSSPMLIPIAGNAGAGAAPAHAPRITAAPAEQRLAFEGARNGLNHDSDTITSSMGSDGYRTAEEDAAWEQGHSDEDAWMPTLAQCGLTSVLQREQRGRQESKLPWPVRGISWSGDAVQLSLAPLSAGVDHTPSQKNGNSGEDTSMLEDKLLTTGSSEAKPITRRRELGVYPITRIPPSKVSLSPASSLSANWSNCSWEGVAPTLPLLGVSNVANNVTPQQESASVRQAPLDRGERNCIRGSSSSSCSSYATEEAARAEGALRAQLLLQSDTLYVEGSYEAGYELLAAQLEQLSERRRQTPTPSLKSEILWRLARLSKELASSAQRQRADEQLSRQLLGRALEHATRALEFDPSNFAAHKWFAISVSQTSAFDGTKVMIQRSFIVKKHLEEAARLNPRDATSRHLLGLWYFEVASLSWATRKVAAVIFMSPPAGSYPEALQHFLHAEQLEQGFYIKNRLMIAKAQLKLRNLVSAREWLQKALQMQPSTAEDHESLAEARNTLHAI